MVASLYAYAEQREATDQIFTAADTAIRRYIKRGRTEVAVEHLDGQPWFGHWRAKPWVAKTIFPDVPGEHP